MLNGVFDENQGVVKSYCTQYMTSHLMNYKDEDSSFMDGCTNASSYITTINLDPNINKYPFCEYTNYWFYGKLKSTDKITNYKTLLEKFFGELVNFDDCINNTESIDDPKYNYINKLDEMYDNFYIFKKEPSPEDDNPCDKGKKCVQDYKRLVSTCMENGMNSFCNELENFRVSFNDHLKSKNKCENIKELPSFQGSPLAPAISIPFSVGKLFVQN
ncbi:hypothetical protein PCYB_008180 [Plasmodium cynomolgi strain B]|uniref:CYIR protein n=1 Tax=Plasmodium cynomolgi (strain B) TaxID=1120755 RepID=K6V148_PLACD|nr:hypothetical protein PCYB_008180 [Plasmodium cynomolgi strain B]GAB70069.1 hypothetical protein PCYB_008180 [Plasmodium cynomolgi strain B]